MSSWADILELLAIVEVEQREFVHRLMHACLLLSSGSTEEDASHALLPDQQQHVFDLACDRAARMERQGYMTAAQAHAFLAEARGLNQGAAEPPRSAIAVAYFRALGSSPVS